MLGQLSPAGDRWQLRFSRRLAHPPAKVWRAITEAEHLRSWFPSTIDGDRRTGSALTFEFPEAAGTPPIHGEMLAFEPPKLLEFRWGDDILRFELEPDGDGTSLVLVDTFMEQGKAARDAAGWHECLDLLADELTDRATTRTLGSRWPELNARYAAEFGEAAATIGPPRDWRPEGA